MTSTTVMTTLARIDSLMPLALRSPTRSRKTSAAGTVGTSMKALR